MLDICLLGTGGMMPLPYRWLTSMMARCNGSSLLIDCGEGTQRQMTRAGVSARSINVICLTHLHGDHCLGLPGVLQRISLEQVPHPVTVVYPAQGQEYVERLHRASIYHDQADIRFLPVDAGPEPGEVLRTKDFILSAACLDHRVPAIGYRVEDLPGVSFDPEALAILTAKKNLRLLKAAPYTHRERVLHPISGGALLQRPDRIDAPGDDPANWELKAGEAADDATLADLAFAWRACRAVKSNAILLAHDGASVGVGMGQVNRVDSCRLAIERAGERAAGSVAASDAFFPFADGLQVLIDAGVRAVVQPGGSIRDQEVIDAAQAAGVTMYLTGTRHFSH